VRESAEARDGVVLAAEMAPPADGRKGGEEEVTIFTGKGKGRDTLERASRQAMGAAGIRSEAGDRSRRAGGGEAQEIGGRGRRKKKKKKKGSRFFSGCG
jgi:hypothetical protein